MKISKEFILREIAGDYILVPVGKAAAEFNGMININETGAFLFNLMVDEFTVEQLVESLCQEYDVSSEQALEDVNDFIERLKIYHIL